MHCLSKVALSISSHSVSPKWDRKAAETTASEPGGGLGSALNTPRGATRAAAEHFVPPRVVQAEVGKSGARP